MDIKYNVSKIKGSKEEIVKDAVSVEEPLEMRLKYKKNGKIETQNISITMRTPVYYTHLTLPTKRIV